jgi:hypothetical protein
VKRKTSLIEKISIIITKPVLSHGCLREINGAESSTVLADLSPKVQLLTMKALLQQFPIIH